MTAYITDYENLENDVVYYFKSYAESNDDGIENDFSETDFHDMAVRYIYSIALDNIMYDRFNLGEFIADWQACNAK